MVDPPIFVLYYDGFKVTELLQALTDQLARLLLYHYLLAWFRRLFFRQLNHQRRYLLYLFLYLVWLFVIHLLQNFPQICQFFRHGLTHLPIFFNFLLAYFKLQSEFLDESQHFLSKFLDIFTNFHPFYLPTLYFLIN